MNILRMNFDKITKPTFMAKKEPKITIVPKETLPQKMELTEMEMTLKTS